MEKRALEEHVAEWANRVGDGLDDLPQEKGRDVLRLLLDEVTIDGESKVNLTLAVPREELCRWITGISLSQSQFCWLPALLRLTRADPRQGLLFTHSP